jgi:L,D-transpeptidase ErfK/SrfK
MKWMITLTMLAGLTVTAAEPQRKVIVSLTERKLALMVDGKITEVYPVAVGKPKTPTPEGTFQIVSRVPDPTWWGPGKVVAPGPGNPLGNRWIGLSQKGYGIHGTNAPRSIGKAASHGCIRMRKADVEALFNKLAVGDTVELTSATLTAATAPEAPILMASGGGE